MVKYTVKKLARLSGVSVRTLHFYDEIGLLKPASHGENRYRYYEENELLLLQQILFFRELGFSLQEIQKVITSNNFDKVKALKSHRATLEKKAHQTQTLIQTIDKTIAKLKGKKTMKNKEMYLGFDAAKQAEHEKYLVERYGKETQSHIDESKKRVEKLSKEELEKIGKNGNDTFIQLVNAMKKGKASDAEEVQKLIRLHYQWVCNFWTPNRSAYIGLAQLYTDHPDFRKFYEPYDPKLVDFLAAAMKFFAEKSLTE